MKKILSPISGWQFFAVVFSIFCFDLLFVHLLFFQTNAYFPYVYLLIKIIIVFFAAFKRLVDVYGTYKKSFFITLFFAIPWAISMFCAYSSIFDGFLNSIQDLRNPLCYIILSFSLFLFLVFRRNGQKNSLTFKTVFMRTACVLSILFYIFQFIRLYNCNLISPDFKMYPSIEIGDGLLMYNKFNCFYLKRFDVVVLYDGKDLIYTPMRVIGMPGEKVEIKDNKIYINDKLLDDKYAFKGDKLMPVKLDRTVKLGNREYFVMGDNRYFKTGGKYLIKNKQTDKEEWQEINSGENAYVVSRKMIKGKIVAINYFDNSKSYAKSLNIPYDKKLKRGKSGVSLITKDKTLEHNPSKVGESLFGKNSEERSDD